jgi:hypothetical protein
MQGTNEVDAFFFDVCASPGVVDEFIKALEHVLCCLAVRTGCTSQSQKKIKIKYWSALPGITLS